METAFLYFTESLGNCYDHSHFRNRILTNNLQGSVLSPELNSEHSGSLNSKKRKKIVYLSACLTECMVIEITVPTIIWYILSAELCTMTLDNPYTGYMVVLSLLQNEDTETRKYEISLRACRTWWCHKLPTYTCKSHFYAFYVIRVQCFSLSIFNLNYQLYSNLMNLHPKF